MGATAAPEVVLDGLVYRSQGYGEELAAGGVHAFHVTAWPFQADFEQALDHVAEWHRRIERDPRLRLIRTVDDFYAAIAAGQAGVVLGTQNARPIGSNLDRVRLFKMLGVNIVQLTYMERNFYGDGCLEPEPAGLSRLGRLLVRELQRCGITVDLSHVGRRSALEAVSLAEAPMLFTHANCKAICDVARNKTDEEIKAVAATGGVIGISCYGRFLWRGPGHPRPTLDDYIAHLEHVIDLVGIDHVGVGTDSPVGLPRTEIDAFIQMMNTTYADFLGPYLNHIGSTFEDRYAQGFLGAADFPKLRRRLLDRGYDAGSIAKILGGNFVRAFRETWKV